MALTKFAARSQPPHQTPPRIPHHRRNSLRLPPTVATLSACSVLPINPFHGAFSKGTSLDALTATTHVQELKDRGANQVELLALQLENGELGSVAVTVPATASSSRTWSQWHLDDSDGSQFSDEPLDDVLGAITTFSPTEAPIADLVAAVHKRATEDPRCSVPDMLTHVSYRVAPSGKASVETFCAPSDDIVNRNGELTITDDVAGLSDPSSAAAGDGAVTIDRPLNLLQADDMRTLLHYGVPSSVTPSLRSRCSRRRTCRMGCPVMFSAGRWHPVLGAAPSAPQRCGSTCPPI